MAQNNRIFTFETGPGKNKKLLGGKGAGLCEMTSIGLPVPPGFVITTEVCKEFYSAGSKLPSGLMDEVKQNIKYIEAKTGKKLGDHHNPLLVSVRYVKCFFFTFFTCCTFVLTVI